MADFERNLSLEDALTDNPPEIEAEIKRDFISTLEAEPYDDVIGETCGKCDYIPLLDDDAGKSGDHEHQNKPKADGNHVERAAASQPAVLENGDRGIGENFMTESSRVSMNEEKMYSEFRTQKEPWQLEPELCFEPQPVFQPVQQSAAPIDNEAFKDDWLGEEESEEAKDLEYFAKKEGSFCGTPGEVLHEHSPWEAASFPVETPKDDHTGSHWQPTIEEQQVLGMHHQSEPSHTAEFALLEDSAGTVAALAGEVEFSGWQHTETRVPLDSSETLDNNGNIPNAPTFDEAGVPETNVAGEEEFFSKHDLLKESRHERMENDPVAALVAVEMVEDKSLLQHISKPQQELQGESSEPTEIVEDKEIESESLNVHPVAIQGATDFSEGDYLPQQNPNIERVPNVLEFEVATLSLETVIPKDETLQQKNVNEENIPVDIGFEGVAIPRRMEDVLELLGSEETSVPQDEPLPHENIIEVCPPEVLGLEANNVSLEIKIPDDKSLLQQNSNKESISDILEVVVEAISLGVEESLSQQNSGKQSIHEVCGINPDAVLVTEQLSKIHQEHHEEAMELEKHMESEPEALTFGEAAVNEIADEETLLQQSSHKSVPDVLKLGAGTVSLGMEDESSPQQSSSILEELVLDTATPSLGLEEESSQHPNDISDRVSEVLAVHEPLSCQDLELQQQYHEGPAAGVEQKITIPAVLPLDTDDLHVDRGISETKTSSHVDSEPHHEQPTAKSLAPALTHDQREVLSEASSPKAFSSPSSVGLQEDSPYLGPHLDPHVAPADVIESDVNFSEARSPADGACMVEEEKHTADPCHVLHSEPGTLLQSADALKVNVPEAPAPTAVSVLEDHKSEPYDLHTEEPVLDSSAPVKQVSIPSDRVYDQAKPAAVPVANIPDKRPSDLWQQKAIDSPLAPESRSDTRTASRTKALHKKAAELMETKRETVEDEWNPEGAPAMIKKKKKKPKQKKTLQPKAAEVCPGNGAGADISCITPSAAEMLKSDIQSGQPIENLEGNKSLGGYAVKEATKVIEQTSPGSDSASVSTKQHIPSPTQQIMQTKQLMAAPSSREAEQFVKGEQMADSLLLQSHNKPSLLPMTVLENRAEITKMEDTKMQITPKGAGFKNKSKKHSDQKVIFPLDKNKEFGTQLDSKPDVVSVIDSNVQQADTAHFGSKTLEEKKRTQPSADESKNVDVLLVEQPSLLENKSNVAPFPVELTRGNITETSIGHENKKVEFNYPDFNTEYEKDNPRVQGCVGPQRSDKLKKSRNADRRKKVAPLESPHVFESKIAGGKGQASSLTPLNENTKPPECADRSVPLQNVSSDHLQTKKRQNLHSCGELVEKEENFQGTVSLNSQTDVESLEAKHGEFDILSSTPNVPVDIKTDLEQVEVFSEPAEAKGDMIQVKSLFEPDVPFQSVKREGRILFSELDLCPEIKDGAVHTQALSEASPTEGSKIDIVNIKPFSEPLDSANSKASSVQVSSESTLTAEGPIALQASSEPAVHDESKAYMMGAGFSKLPVSEEHESAMTPCSVSSEHQLSVYSKKCTAPVSSEPVAFTESKGDLALVSSAPVKSKESATDSTDSQVDSASSVSSTQGTVKESSLIGNKKSGRGSLKRPHRDSKGAKTSIVAQGEEIAKDNSLPHQSKEGKIKPSKHSLSLEAKADVPVCTLVPLLQDNSSTVSIFEQENEESTGIFNLKEGAASLPSVLKVQDVCKAGALDEVKEASCTLVQRAASLGIEADFSDITSTNDKAKENSHVEQSQKGGLVPALPLNIVESTERPGKDSINALTKDKTIRKRIKEVKKVKGLHSETPVGFDNEADGPEDRAVLEKENKTSLSDKITSDETSLLECSAYLECPAAVEMYPSAAQLDEQVNISFLETGDIDAPEITDILASPIVIDNKSNSSVSLDINGALPSSSKSHSISDVSLSEPPVMALKEETGQPSVSDKVDGVKHPSFEAFLSCDGNTDSVEVPQLSPPAEGTLKSPVVDKVKKSVTPEDAVIKNEVSSNDEIPVELAHLKPQLEKPVKSGQAEAKKGAKTDLKVRESESIKGYMRPTKSRGLPSPQPRSPVHDAMNANQTRDLSTSQRRPEKVNLELSSVAEAISESITAPPSKELPPSPEKKAKASAVAASAKPAAAKGRSASTTTPKHSTPPPDKKTGSLAPVASSTPKRPASSSARSSNLTPKDTSTPRSSTFSPKEMKPKGLNFKSPAKSPEEKTPVTKASAAGTPRAAVKPATGTPKAAMVPAVAVASTTPRRPTTIKTDAKPVEAKKATPTAKSADLSRPKTAPVTTGKSNATTPSSPGTNYGPAAPVNRPKPAKPLTKTIPESNSTTDGKKVPSAKAPVSKVNVVPKTARPGSVPAPDLKNVRSKIGSTDNLKHQPGGGRAKIEKKPESVGAPRKPAAPLPVTRTATTKTTVSKETAQKDTNGRVAKPAPSKKVQPVNAPKSRPGSANVQILNKKVDTSKVTAKCGSKVNLKHKPGGGDVKIENHKSNVKDKVQSKVGSLDNVGHAPAGGKVKSEGNENAGDMAQTPQNGDLSTPQALAGPETHQNEVPAEGSDQRETQNFDNQIQETSI
ncbi:microtubule-associated protein 4 isoform X7 [Lissotriton helveticus]